MYVCICFLLLLYYSLIVLSFFSLPLNGIIFLKSLGQFLRQKYVFCFDFMYHEPGTFVLAGYFGPSHKKKFIFCIVQMIQDNLEFLPLKNILHPSIKYLNSLRYFNFF